MNDEKSKNKRGKNLGLFKRFLPYYKKHFGALAFDLFCAAFTVVSEMSLPVIARNITDTAINSPAALTLGYIAKIAAFYLAIRILDCAANYYMAAGGHVMGVKMETEMRRDLFSHLQSLPFSYYDNNKIGQLMSRITSDLFDIAEFAHHCPEEYFIASLKFLASFIYLSFINIRLTLLMFIPLPLMIVVSKRFRTQMRSAFSAQRHRLGEINAGVEDSLLGIRVVKSFANEDVEREKFAEENGKFYDVKRKTYFSMANFHTTVRFFDGLMYILVVSFGAVFLLKKKITPADFTAYLLMVGMLLGSVRQILQFSEQFQRGMSGIERFTEIIDTPPEEDGTGKKELTDVKGGISFRDVSFSYSEENPEVFRNINIEIAPGKNVAVVGPSGGGKTTVCNLIPRFYTITGGEIDIDGEDIGDFSLKSLRENIGVVQQDVYLFSGSVRQNIAYGRQDATDEEIIEAAKKAGAHDFISELPQGYDTYVGERGVKLSGGQKQRISIARVFLKNPPILILDEATSALDNESEMLIQRSLDELAKGRTTLIVAHRLTTVKNADEIIVLTKDGITERGTHSELLAANGAYASMYRLYSA